MPAMPPQPTCAAAAYKPPSPRQLGHRRAFPASPSLLLGCRSSMRQSRARSIFTSGENRKILPGKGGVPERPNGTVLKTVGGSRPPWVRIPLPPPKGRRLNPVTHRLRGSGIGGRPPAWLPGRRPGPQGVVLGNFQLGPVAEPQRAFTSCLRQTRRRSVKFS